MSALAFGIATALVALRCQLLTDDPYILGSVSRVLPSTRPAFLEALNKTRRLVGCPPEGDPEEPPGPFVGGQCPVLYNINWTWSAGSFNSGPQSSQRVGPLSFSREGTGSLDCGPGGDVYNVFILIDGTGASPIALATGCGAQLNSLSVSRADGLPDNCGSLPGVYPPPTNIETDIDVTYNIEGDTEVTVTIPFIFAPIDINLDGTLQIPFTFDFGGFEFSGDINLPDFDVTINPPGLPPGDGEDIDPIPPDDPDDRVPPLPAQSKIVGAVVACTIDSPSIVGSIDFEGGPDTIIPRAASVKFAYSFGGATFWSPDIDVKTLRSFVPCPFSQGADAVVVSPSIGVTVTTVPITGFPLATTQDVRTNR